MTMFGSIATLAPPGTPSRRAPVVGAAMAVACLGGTLAVAVAWQMASSTVRVERQVTWGVVAAAGATILCAASVLWVLAARRKVASRLIRLTYDVRSGLPETPSTAATVLRGPETLVAAASMVRYHRPACPLAVGKLVGDASRAEHERAGRRPCGVCGP